MTKFVITGGCGFIGSHVVDRIAREFPAAKITILDKMTYAADIRNVIHVLDWDHRQIKVGDVADPDLCLAVTENADCVIHLAAESHVDNSFSNSLAFTRSNAVGTHALMEACLKNKVGRIIHVSTDEVYGEIIEGAHTETSPLHPTNPYAASKAAADMIVSGYIQSFDLPVTTVRSNNIFGIRQFPEKIIPRFALAAISREKMPVHGDGRNVRRYLAATDFAEAIVLLLESGNAQEIYNIGSEEEYSNFEVARMICAETGVDVDETVAFVTDRPFNDFRYSLDCGKIHALGWKPVKTLAESIGDLVAWYGENRHRYSSLFGPSPTPLPDNLVRLASRPGR